MKAKDLEELKRKVRAPSILPKGSARSHAVETPKESIKPVSKEEKTVKAAKSEQAAADRSGIKVRSPNASPNPYAHLPLMTAAIANSQPRSRLRTSAYDPRYRHPLATLPHGSPDALIHFPIRDHPAKPIRVHGRPRTEIPQLRRSPPPGYCR